MDIVQFFVDLSIITLLGLLVAFNPMLIAVDIVLVLRSKRPILNTSILIAGFISSLTLLFVVATLLIDPDSQFSLRKIKDTLELPAIIDILAGALLIGWALKRLGAAGQKRIVMPANLKVPESPTGLFAFAFVKAALSATNVFAVLVLAKVSAANGWNPALGAMAIFWLLAIGVIPLLTLAYLRQFKHKSLVSIDKKLNSLLARDITSVINYIIGGVGIFFLASGIIEILEIKL